MSSAYFKSFKILCLQFTVEKRNADDVWANVDLGLLNHFFVCLFFFRGRGESAAFNSEREKR